MICGEKSVLCGSCLAQFHVHAGEEKLGSHKFLADALCPEFAAESVLDLLHLDKAVPCAFQVTSSVSGFQNQSQQFQCQSEIQKGFDRALFGISAAVQ